MSIGISSRKSKARNLQNEVAQRISDLLNIPCGKDQLIQGREMGQSGVDIKLIGEALKRFQWSVECKRQENLSIPAWIRQAQANIIPDTNWLLVVRRNHEKAFVVLDIDAFFELLKKGNGQ